MIALGLVLLFLALAAAGTTPEGVTFLAQNAKAEGVVVLPSGLQYKVVKKGTTSKKSPLVTQRTYHPPAALAHCRSKTTNN
jgi:hypothetical protein